MFDATHLQNVQPTATVNVAQNSNFQEPITRETQSRNEFNTQTRELAVGALEILWNLNFGTWNFPTNRKFCGIALLA
jgi:hypothetical protein